MSSDIATYVTALMASLAIYEMLDQFFFDHPTITVSGPSGPLDVDMSPYLVVRI